MKKTLCFIAFLLLGCREYVEKNSAYANCPGSTADHKRHESTVNTYLSLIERYPNVDLKGDIKVESQDVWFIQKSEGGKFGSYTRFLLVPSREELTVSFHDAMTGCPLNDMKADLKKLTDQEYRDWVNYFEQEINSFVFKDSSFEFTELRMVLSDKTQVLREKERQLP